MNWKVTGARTTAAIEAVNEFRENRESRRVEHERIMREGIARGVVRKHEMTAVARSIAFNDVLEGIEDYMAPRPNVSGDELLSEVLDRAVVQMSPLPIDAAVKQEIASVALDLARHMLTKMRDAERDALRD